MQTAPYAPDRAALDVCGRRRSPATYPAFHRGRPPANRGQKYPADPPTIPEIVALLDACPTATTVGARNRALLVVLWRTGLRCSEALDLTEQDLDPRARSVLVRAGKGGKRRLVGMDDLGWTELDPWLAQRRQLPVGPLFCIVQGPTTGRRWNGSGVRRMIVSAARVAGVRRRMHPHGLRHAHACELAREGVALHIIQRQLGHSNPGTTAIYLGGIAPVEVIDAIGARPTPTVPALM